MHRILVVAIALYLSACQAADRSASYVEGEISISLELFHMHTFLAEYEREVALSLNGRELTRQRLFPDTGGYAETNLYKCGNNQYWVKGYFDSWVVNLDTPSITEGLCKNAELIFLGAFHGAGSKPWVFSPASDRQEQPLEAKGG